MAARIERDDKKWETIFVESPRDGKESGKAAWRPDSHWMIDANVSLLDAKYKNFSNADGLNPAAGIQVLDRNRLNQSLKFSDIPKNSANQTQPEIVDKARYRRSKYHLGSIWIVWYLAHCHGITMSDTKSR